MLCLNARARGERLTCLLTTLRKYVERYVESYVDALSQVWWVGVGVSSLESWSHSKG